MKKSFVKNQKEGLDAFDTAFVYINVLTQFAKAHNMPYKTLDEQLKVTTRYEQVASRQN